MESETRTLFRKSFWLFLARTTISMSGLLFWIILGRFTSKAQLGYATTIFSMVFAFSALSTLGAEYVVLKLGKSPEERDKALSSFILLEIISGGILALSMFLWGGRGTYSINYKEYAVLGSILILNSCLRFPAAPALVSSLRSDLVLAISLAGSLSRLSLGAFLAYYFSKVLGIQIPGIYILGISVISSAISLSLSYYFLLKNFKISFKGSFSYLKKVVREGIPNLPSKLFFIIISNLGVILLAFLAKNASLTGETYICIQILIAITGISGSMATVSLPMSYGEKEAYKASMAYGLPLTALAASLAISSPSRVLWIVKPQLSSAWPSLWIMALASIPLSVVFNLTSKFNARRKYKELAMMGGILLISFISSLLIFLHLLPNLSVSLAILFSSWITLDVMIYYEGGWFFKTLGYSSLAVLGAGIVGILTSNVLGGWASFAFGFLTCSAILYLTGALKPKDLREIIRALLPKGS